MSLFSWQRRRALDRVEFGTVVGAGTRLRGRFAGGDNLTIYGEVEGNSDIEGVLVLAEGARWVGDLTASHVVIGGEVVGHVSARTRLELRATARVRGDIASPVIVMAEGAVFDGEIRMRADSDVTQVSERRGN